MDVPCDFPDVEVLHLRLDRRVRTLVRHRSSQKQLLRSPAHFSIRTLWDSETHRANHTAGIWVRGTRRQPLSSRTCSGQSGAAGTAGTVRRGTTTPAQHRGKILGTFCTLSKNSSMTLVDVDRCSKCSTCTTGPPCLEADLGQGPVLFSEGLTQ